MKTINISLPEDAASVAATAIMEQYIVLEFRSQYLGDAPQAVRDQVLRHKNLLKTASDAIVKAAESTGNERIITLN